MIENKDIKFRVLYEDAGITGKFASLDNIVESTSKKFATLDKTVKSTSSGFGSTNSLLMSTSRIVQDLPFGILGVGNNLTFMAEQFAYARKEGASFKEIMRDLGKSLFTGSGAILVGFSAIISYLTMMGRNTENVQSATKSFIDEVIRGSNSSAKYAESIGMVNKALIALTNQDLQQRIADLTGTLNSFWSGITWMFNKEGFANNILGLKLLLDEQNKRNLGKQFGGNEQGLIERLKSQIENYTFLRDSAQTLSEQAGYQATINALNKELEKMLPSINKHHDDTNKKLKETKEYWERIEKLEKDYVKWLKDIEINKAYGTDGAQKKLAEYVGIGRVGNTGNPSENMLFANKAQTESFGEQMKFMTEIVKDNLQIIRGEFSTLWQDVFGEANSLFEKLLMNFASRLAERGISSLFGSLLNFIFPGAGMALGAISGGDRGRTQPIVLKVDDRVFAEVVQESLNNADMYRIKS